MNIINLVPYIQEGIFLHDKLLPYDCIVWEKMPLEADTRYTHVTLADVGYDFGISGKMAALSEKHARILLVSETLNAIYLVPWLSNLPKDAHVTVLQVAAGIAGYTSKSHPDMDDIGMMFPYAHVLEAYDQETLISAMTATGKNYIRIPRGETQDVLFPKQSDIDGGIADLRVHGFDGEGGTVIAPGGVLINTIHALQDLHNEGKFFDLFALLEYDFTIGKAIKESIIKTENVIVLLDQHRRTTYEAIIKAKLWDAGLVDTNIQFVYPNTDKIHTILPEYLWEQANRDGVGIAEKLNSLS